MLQTKALTFTARMSLFQPISRLCQPRIIYFQYVKKHYRMEYPINVQVNARHLRQVDITQPECVCVDLFTTLLHPRGHWQPLELFGNRYWSGEPKNC